MANELAGIFGQSQTGQTRYQLVQRFEDVSNANSGTTPGHTKFSPVGLPFRDPNYDVQTSELKAAIEEAVARNPHYARIHRLVKAAGYDVYAVYLRSKLETETSWYRSQGSFWIKVNSNQTINQAVDAYFRRALELVEDQYMVEKRQELAERGTIWTNQVNEVDYLKEFTVGLSEASVVMLNELTFNSIKE